MKQTKGDESPVFTVDEHLWVQHRIENRAHELWLLRGSQQDAALDNWLHAEREVLENFIVGRTRNGFAPYTEISNADGQLLPECRFHVG
jgi:hypothetical protein